MDNPGPMSRSGARPRFARVAVLIGAAALLLGAIVLQRRSALQLRPTPEQSAARTLTATTAPQRELPAAVAPTAAPAGATSGSTEPAGFDPTRHAHPITAEHLRLYREDELLDGAWQALRRRDFTAARQLVATHDAEYRDSKAHMSEGLLLLADCLQRPSSETKARAQAFYDEKTYSPMRRRLRRLCLEAR